MNKRIDHLYFILFTVPWRCVVISGVIASVGATSSLWLLTFKTAADHLLRDWAPYAVPPRTTLWELGGLVAITLLATLGGYVLVVTARYQW